MKKSFVVAAAGLSALALVSAPAATAAPAQSVTLYDNVNFDKAGPAERVVGVGKCLNVGRENVASSLIVNGEGAIRAWEGKDCRGDVRFFVGQVADLRPHGFDNKISSVRILPSNG